MTTFALIPGAWHGAWCWERVAARLIAAGHAVVTMDLPCDDPAAGCAAYARIVVDAVADVHDDLVLVGHSAGGLTAPLVAAARPAARLVFLSALLPVPGRPFTEQNRAEHILQREYQAGVEPDENDCRRWFDAELAARTLYSGCRAEDAAWAFGRLRAQSSTIYAEPSPLEQWPELPVTDIRGNDDQIVSPAWAARAVPERLGVTSIVIDGAGHSSMLSHPCELADLLLAS